MVLVVGDFGVIWERWRGKGVKRKKGKGMLKKLNGG